MKKVFISYARNDDEQFAHRLYSDLTNAGFDVWFDRKSMPSRQLSFLQEIRDVLVTCDRVILIVGPKAVVSDYVNQEWQFAYFVANKCINPIVRLDKTDDIGNVVDGFNLIPEDLKLMHAEDFRINEDYQEHLSNLIRQLSEDLPPLGKLVAVPELPPGYIAQPDRIRVLKDLLLADLHKPSVSTGVSTRIGLDGMGGIGKSVLARVVARHPEVQRAFPDGVYWIQFGQTPNVLALQTQLVEGLGHRESFHSESEAREKIRILIADLAVLLILDDVWEREHAEMFNVIGPLGRILLTSRDASLVTALCSHENHYKVNLPSESEAIAMISYAANISSSKLPTEAYSVIQECGRLPLALSLCGGLVNSGVGWDDILDALQDNDLEYLSDDHPLEPQHSDIWKTINVSISMLSNDQKNRFMELAVFPLGCSIPVNVITDFWEYTGGLTSRNARKLIANFSTRSLIEITENKTRDGITDVVRIHDLLSHYAVGICEKQHVTEEKLHKMLLDSYSRHTSDRFESGPDDGYYFSHLCYHLMKANMADVAFTLLTSLSWIEALCRRELYFNLLLDYDFYRNSTPSLRLLRNIAKERKSELLKWSNDLVSYSRAGTQEIGDERLSDNSNNTKLNFVIPKSRNIISDKQLDEMQHQVISNPSKSDILDAFEKFVKAEGFHLNQLGRLEGFVVQHAYNYAPQGPVHDAATHLITLTDRTYIVRDRLDEQLYQCYPALLKTLKAINNDITCADLTPDGSLLVTGGRKNTIDIWDIESGKCVKSFDEVDSYPVCLAVTPDARIAVSGRSNNSVRIWDLSKGICLHTLYGHTERVRCCSISTDGSFAVTGGDDHLVILWDIKSGRKKQVLPYHQGAVCTLKTSLNGKYIFSGGEDKTGVLWDSQTGKRLGEFEGHTGFIWDCVFTTDCEQIVTCSGDKTIKAWEVSTGRTLFTLEGHEGLVTTLGLTADGSKLFSGSYDRTIRVWDMNDKSCLRIVNCNEYIEHLSLSADGDIVVSVSGNTAKVWDIAGGQSPSKEDSSKKPDLGNIIRNDKYIVTYGYAAEVIKVYNNNLELVQTFEIGESNCIIDSLKLLNDNLHMLRIDYSAFGLSIWSLDILTGNAVRVREYVIGEIISLTISSSLIIDVKPFILGLNKLSVYDIQSNDLLLSHICSGPTINKIEISSDYTKIACAKIDGSISVLDLITGDQIIELDALGKIVVSLSFSSNSCHLLATTAESDFYYWDLREEQPLFTFNRTIDSVCCVNRSDDGSIVVTERTDGVTQIWNTAKHKLDFSVNSLNTFVKKDYISTGNKYLFSMGSDNRLSVLNLITGKYEAVYCCGDASEIIIDESAKSIIVNTVFGSISLLMINNIDFERHVPDAVSYANSTENHYGLFLEKCISNCKPDEDSLEDNEYSAILRSYSLYLRKQDKIEEAMKWENEALKYYKKIDVDETKDTERRDLISKFQTGTKNIFSEVFNDADDLSDNYRLNKHKLKDMILGNEDGAKSIITSMLDESRVEQGLKQINQLNAMLLGNQKNDVFIDNMQNLIDKISGDDDDDAKDNEEQEEEDAELDVSKLLELMTTLCEAIWSDKVKHIVFTPNSKIVITCCGNGLVKVLDFVTQKCLHELSGISNKLNCVCVSNDGKKLLIGYQDYKIAVYNMCSGQCERLINELQESVGAVRSLFITSDDKYVVVGGSGTEILVFSLDYGTIEKSITGLDKGVANIALSKDGNVLVVCLEDGAVKIFSFISGLFDRTLVELGTYAAVIDFSFDSNLLVTAGNDNEVRVWNTDNWDCIYSFTGLSSKLKKVYTSIDKTLLIAVSEDLYLYSLTNGTCVDVYKHHTKINEFAVSPDGVSACILDENNEIEFILMSDVFKVYVESQRSNNLQFVPSYEEFLENGLEYKVEATCKFSEESFNFRTALVSFLETSGNQEKANNIRNEMEILHSELLEKVKKLDDIQTMLNIALEKDSPSLVEELYNQQLSLRELVRGKHHWEVASSLTNLAVFYRDNANLEKSENINERALDLYISALGESNVRTVNCGTNLSLVKFMLGKYDEAVELSNIYLDKHRKNIEDLDVIPDNQLKKIANCYYEWAVHSDVVTGKSISAYDHLQVAKDYFKRLDDQDAVEKVDAFLLEIGGQADIVNDTE